MLKVRPLEDGDVASAVRLHLEVLDMEFLSRFGPGFMRTYYQAWRGSPGAIALVARDERDELVGVLLGASDPAAHVQAMVRHYGLRLALRLLGYALVHPRLAKDLVVTRSRRYVRGLLRLVTSRLSRGSAPISHGAATIVGEITHVLVSPRAQGQGIGRALMDAAVTQARGAGVDELTLVTPPDMAARDFYEHLGWQLEGEMRSRSGEEFLRFRYRLT